MGDTAFSFRNKIINGKMEIAQRGTSFAAIANGAYFLDRYLFGNTSTAVITASQQADVPTGNQFQSSLRLAVTTASTSDAVCNIQHRIEGYNVRDLIGRDFTLSFWVRSSKTGVHCVSFRNSGSDRSYVTEYTINSADTWETKSVTVSGGLITAGTWDWTNGIGLLIGFALRISAAATTGAPNSWQTGNLQGTSAHVNCLDTIGNIFAITGVQLEAGSVATPFESRPYGTELALCQRYYYRATPGGANNYFGIGQVASANTVVAGVLFPAPMRASPSALEQSGVASDYKVAVAGSSQVACTSVPAHIHATSILGVVNFTSTSLGGTVGQSSQTAAGTTSSYLGWSAEL
jgi:hypothetical protein